MNPTYWFQTRQAALQWATTHLALAPNQIAIQRAFYNDQWMYWPARKRP